MAYLVAKLLIVLLIVGNVAAQTSQRKCPADEKGNKRVWDSVGNLCNCPTDLPLWNGRYCVACPVGTEFDPK